MIDQTRALVMVSALQVMETGFSRSLLVCRGCQGSSTLHCRFKAQLNCLGPDYGSNSDADMTDLVLAAGTGLDPLLAPPSSALLVYLLLSLVALAAQIPQNEHAGARGIAVLQAREQITDSPTTTDSTTAATDAATTAAATNNASSTSSTTASTPTTTASLDQTSIAISGYTP
jgi:hypothetical protein